MNGKFSCKNISLARSKTKAQDNRRYKVELLFYHRILKCHVVGDLKTEEFTHEDAGQMNFYLNYHRKASCEIYAGIGERLTLHQLPHPFFIRFGESRRRWALGIVNGKVIKATLVNHVQGLLEGQGYVGVRAFERDGKDGQGLLNEVCPNGHLAFARPPKGEHVMGVGLPNVPNVAIAPAKQV